MATSTDNKVTKLRLPEDAGVLKVIATERAGGDTEDLGHHLKAFNRLSAPEPDPSTSKTVGLGDKTTAIVKPIPPEVLIKITELNNALAQCIDAMLVNVIGYGFTLDYIGDVDQRESEESKKEKAYLEGFMQAANEDDTLEELCEKLATDFYTVGYGFIEIIRNTDNEVERLYHVPAETISLCPLDEESVEVEARLSRGAKSASKIKKQFRRYYQEKLPKTEYTWFKEFNDPRMVNPKTGRIEENLSQENSATELYHFRNYHPGNPYGVPVWINQLASALGSVECELTNYDFFQSNAIPALAVLIAGGGLSAESIKQIEKKITKDKGHKSVNRVLILEALGDTMAASEDGTIPVPRIEMKPMSGMRQGDELFENYDKNNRTKIRSAFRLAPLLVGESQDHTNATSDASLQIAESQVFLPGRRKFEALMNKNLLLPRDKTKFQHWNLKLSAPKIVAPENLIDAMVKFAEKGALTINKLIELLNVNLDMEISPYKEPWADLPVAFVLELLKQGKLSGLDGITLAPAEAPTPESSPQDPPPNDPENSDDNA